MAGETERPDVPPEHTDPAEHRRQIAERLNATLTKDGTNAATAPLKLKDYETVGNLPAAALYPNSITMVGGVLYQSDGIAWTAV